MDLVDSDSTFGEKITGDRLVLVVDDNEDNLLLAQFVLESLNCTILTETSGYRAVRVAEERRPDLILLDIFMPDIDGFEMMQMLQQNSSTRQIPVIAVSAMVRLNEREQVYEAGFVDFVNKPYDVEELQATVKRYLEASK